MPTAIIGAIVASYLLENVEVAIDTDPRFCTLCGYNLRGNPTTSTCPECGEQLTPGKAS